MASEVFQLALLLTLKDSASNGLDRFGDRLRAAGKDGEKFHSQFEQIRKDLNRDLAIGSVGMAGLALMSKGVQIAGNYQASVTELRNSFSQLGKDGKVDLTSLGADMLKAEAVAMKLGNTLPGTTEDFVQMMQVLKQNGLDAKTILGGAADAVGNLAVSSKVLPREIAADFAQYGNLFKLRPQDYIPAADLFSRINTSTGQTASELVEAAKYFEGRTGQSLGIKGLKDAEQFTRLFGLMGKSGMRGSMAGMGLTNFFDEYNQHRDKIEDLTKQTGIKLDFFDKAGKFVGLEEVITQMSQFNRLSEKDRSMWMQEIFGTLGKGAGNILMNADAWKQFNAEQDRTIGLSAKNAEISKNLNNQVEALTGSATNLVVTAFTPLLPKLTGAANSLNQLVGSVTDFTRTHPALMETLGTIALYGSTALVAYGGIKTLTSGVRILRLASQFSRSEGILQFMNEVPAASSKASTSVAGFTGTVKTANREVGGLRGRLNQLSQSGAVKITLQMASIMAAEASLVHILSVIGEVEERSKQVEQNAKSANDTYDSLMGQGKMWGAPGVYGGRNASRDELTPLVDSLAKSMEMNRSLEFALQPERAGTFEHFWTSQRPYASPWSTKPGDRFGMPFSSDVAVQRWKDAGITTKMQDPNVLAMLISRLQQDMKLKPEGNEALLRALEKVAGKESFDAAMKISMGQSQQKPAERPMFQLGGMPQSPFPSIQSLPGGNVTPFNINAPMGNVTTLFQGLQPPIAGTTQSFQDLLGPADKLPSSFQKINLSASGVSESLQTVSSNLSNWRPPAVSGMPGGTPSDTPIVTPPGYAVGGTITRSGLAYVHSGEDIVPARAKKYRPGNDGAVNRVVLNAPMTVTINGGGAAAAEEFSEQLDAHTRQLERMLEKTLRNASARA